LWCSHKSHHEHPTARRLVSNDLLWTFPLLTSATFIIAGRIVSTDLGAPLVGFGMGTAGYVFAYILAHDGVAHGRFWVPRFVRRMSAFRALAQTHRLHHRGGREGVGAPPFGVYAAPLEHRFHLSDRYSPPTRICSPAGATATVLRKADGSPGTLV
jgi:sterol desaturase/sphingolipid hydroxylase (fatty acid hydroxylase superfamily)